MDDITDIDDVLNVITNDCSENDGSSRIPTVISDGKHVSYSTTFYSREERLNYNAQYMSTKRRRRGDSGYSGTSSTSLSEFGFEKERELVQKSLETGNLYEQTIEFEYATKPKRSQRPQYPHDGSRGCIRCEYGEAVKVAIDECLPRLQFTDQKTVFALEVGLTDANGNAAKHFEVYNAFPGACNNIFEFDQNVIVFEELYAGKNTISLKRVGIKRKEEKGRAGRLEKECWLRSTLYLVDTNANQVFLCGQTISAQIKCEQEIGPPVILDMEPKQSSSEGGGVLAVKGKNFIPGITRVIFKGTKECECLLAESMASKDMMACYIPHWQDVGGDVVEVFVKIEEKRSASLKFIYRQSQAALYEQNNNECPNCSTRRLGGDFRNRNASYLSDLDLTAVEAAGDQVLPEDQIFIADIANKGELDYLMDICPYT